MARYYSLNQSLLSLGDSLIQGETLRTICPVCWGGRTKEKSFSITRIQTGFLYKCFRASCGKEGIVGATLAHKKKDRVSTGLSKRYMGDFGALPPLVYEEYFKKYDLSVETIQNQGICFATDIGRIHFPIYDYRGWIIGENLKAVSKTQKPKNLINKFNDVPLLHFPLGMDVGKTLVLVEDQVSAIKVSKLYPCASLMGTSVSDEGLKLLKQIGIKAVNILMDGDDAGVTASFKIGAKLEPFFDTRISFLPKHHDPKDISLDKLKEIIK